MVTTRQQARDLTAPATAKEKEASKLIDLTAPASKPRTRSTSKTPKASNSNTTTKLASAKRKGKRSRNPSEERECNEEVEAASQQISTKRARTEVDGSPAAPLTKKVIDTMVNECYVLLFDVFL